MRRLSTLPCAQLLITVAALATLQACGNPQYDQQREWRLRECEKILSEVDKNQCRKNTPHYL